MNALFAAHGVLFSVLYGLWTGNFTVRSGFQAFSVLTVTAR